MSIVDEIAEANEDMLFADEFEEALVGYIEHAGGVPVAVYDKEAVIQLIMEGGCNEEDALDHFYYNVVGTYRGEGTPVFITFVEEE